MQDLGYLAEESEWQGAAISPFAASASTALHALQADTYRNAQPMMVSAEDGLYGVLLRADRRSGEIYAAATKFDGASWAEPVRLDGDAVMDSAPKLFKAQDGTIWVAYAQTDAGADTSTLLDWAKKQTIVVGTLDKDTLAFTKVSSFGGMGYAHSQTLAMVNGQPTLVWVASAVESDNDVLVPAANTVYYAAWDGTRWSEARVLAAISHPIWQIAAGDAGIACNIDMDNNTNTTEDAILTLYSLSGGATELAAGVTGKVTYGTLPGETAPAFLWNSDNCVMTSGGKSVAAEGITGEYAVTGDRIYYSAAGDEGAHLTTVLFDGVDWSPAVTLTGGYRYLENLSLVTWNGTDYLMGMDTLATISPENIADAKNLVWAAVMPSSDLRLDGITYDADGLANGDTVPVKLHIFNAGDHTVKSLTIEADGTAETIPCSLIPGGTLEVERNLTCSGEFVKHRFTISETGMDDFTPGNNRGTVGIGYPDLAVELAELKIGDYQALEATITNEGVSAASGTVRITDENGNSLMEQNFEVIAPGDSMIVTYALESANGDYVASVSCDVTELFSYNNESSIYVGLPSAPDIPSHTHSWSAEWSKNETHHWHECEETGCTVTNDSDKDGYAAHSYDSDADAACNACGYVRAVIPPAPAQTYTLTVTGGTGGGSHAAGAKVSITANAAPEGKQFDKWTTDNGGTFADASSASTTFTMPAGDVTVTATYKDNTMPPTPSHTHSWSAAWSTDADGHWHECATANCPITANAQKDAYAAHVSDGGLVTTPATQTTAGVKTYSCTVCHYGIKTETIPATGGGGSEEKGYSISGTVRSYDAKGKVTVLLLQGADEVSRQEVTDGVYRLEDVAPGNYTLRVGKAKHVQRDYAVTVTDRDVCQDVEIWLAGDINGDGKVNTIDKRLLFFHLSGRHLTGYALQVGDVNGDGKINITDKRLIFYHIAGTRRLW